MSFFIKSQSILSFSKSLNDLWTLSLATEEVKLSSACKENKLSHLLIKSCIYHSKPLHSSCSLQTPPLDWNIIYWRLWDVNNNLQFSNLKCRYLIIHVQATHNSAINIIGSSGLFSIRRVIASFISLVTPVRAVDHMKPKGIVQA